MRLNKFLSESGACSRREADELIAEGRVTINGAPATLGMQVNEGDEVKLDGDIVGEARKKTKPVYIALNKPTGITCTTERQVPGNIIDFVNHDERIFPIGRLDKDSEGLILLTNDGDIVNEVLRAEHNHEKEYVVSVDRAFDDSFITQMSSGVRLSDAHTRRCKVERLGAKVFKITLTQGLNRQIRRMCEALGYTVETLQRIRIMHIHLGQLPLGRWRQLTPQEIEPLLPKPSAQPRPQGPQRPQQEPGASRPGGPRFDGARPGDARPGGSRPAGQRSGGGGQRPGGPRSGGPPSRGGQPSRHGGQAPRHGGQPSRHGGSRPGGQRHGGGRRGRG